MHHCTHNFACLCLYTWSVLLTHQVDMYRVSTVLSWLLLNRLIFPHSSLVAPQLSQVFPGKPLVTTGARSFCRLYAIPDPVTPGWLVFNGTFSTNRLHRAIGARNTLCRVGEPGDIERTASEHLGKLYKHRSWTGCSQ